MSVTSSALSPVCECMCVLRVTLEKLVGRGRQKRPPSVTVCDAVSGQIFWMGEERPGWWLTPNSFHTRRPVLETPLSCLESHQGSFFPSSLCGWQFKILSHSGIRFPAKIWPFIPLEAGGLKRPLFEITCLDFLGEIVVASNIFTSFV